MAERVPPHDLEAESAVLGAMLLNRAAAERGSEVLRADEFYAARNATIFDTIVRALEVQYPTDVVNIAGNLAAESNLERIGGASYLHDLIAAVPIVANLDWYAQIVADHAVRRRLIEAGTRVVQIGYDLNREPGDAAALAQKLLADVAVGRTETGLIPWADIIGPALEAIEEAGNEQRPPGLSTGLSRLDAMTGGFRGGQLVVVGGRPGAGKSIVAVEWARQVAFHQNRAVAIFSLEMSKEEIFNRVAAAETVTSLARITRGYLGDDQWAALGRLAGETESAPLYIDDTAPMSLTDIVARARRMHARTPLAMVVVDYLQLLESGRKSESRQQEVSDISRGLKLLAKELSCPVVAAAQLNRNVEGRGDKRPMLSDLRDSGSVEQDADIVVLLHRENYYNANTPRGNEMDLIVAKHRNGPVGVVIAAADFQHGRLVDMDAKPSAPTTLV